MVKIFELSFEEKQRMIDDINHIMSYNFRIDRESINDFWDTVIIGTEVQKRA